MIKMFKKYIYIKLLKFNKLNNFFSKIFKKFNKNGRRTRKMLFL